MDKAFLKVQIRDSVTNTVWAEYKDDIFGNQVWKAIDELSNREQPISLLHGLKLQVLRLQQEKDYYQQQYIKGIEKECRLTEDLSKIRGILNDAGVV
jgi:hypothetical protein